MKGGVSYSGGSSGREYSQIHGQKQPDMQWPPSQTLQRPSWNSCSWIFDMLVGKWVV